MRRNPQVEDFRRKIRVVFFSKQTSDLESFKPYFPEEYFEVKGEVHLEEVNTRIFSDIPDIIVCTDNIRIAARQAEKHLYYIKVKDFYYHPDEISPEIRKEAYKNYIDKIKHQIKLIIGKDEKRPQKEILNLILNMFDLKDRYLKDHSIRVAYYALKIGKELKLTKEQLQNLKEASLLHDIGKLAIPYQIITKPTNLTKEEKNLYKYHPLIGQYILDFPQFQKIRKSIAFHHERIDGKGYYKKRTADEIPLYARIITVVNAFDNLIATNFYTKRMTKEEVITLFKRYTKKSDKIPFDYRIVKKFLKILDEEKSIFPDMNELLNKM